MAKLALIPDEAPEPSDWYMALSSCVDYPEVIEQMQEQCDLVLTDFQVDIFLRIIAEQLTENT